MQGKLAVAAAGLAVLLAAAYSNHFSNDFHFDDAHTVVDNPHIRTLANWKRLFSDSTAFSVLPTHHVYRPLVTLSLALDYRMGGGLKPVAFHASTFFWYLAQLGAMFWLFRLIVRRAEAPEGADGWALLAVAVYGLHPVSAETVNYIIQRGDIYSTLGVIVGLAIYIQRPGWRRWGVYLIPVVAGALAKPPALIFPVLLLLYEALFRDDQRAGKAWRAIRAVLPAAAVCAVTGWGLKQMVPASFDPGAPAAGFYRATQGYVTWTYFGSFFAPVGLSADTDLRPAESLLDARLIYGLLFVALLAGFTIWSAQRERLRPLAFGLGWFLAALAPTALMPLAEVANDHRMYFPFVGLTLAAAWAARLALGSGPASPILRRAAGIGLGAALLAAAYGTRQRNEVWRDEESLWLDVTQKSPTNGRGLMNYGLTQMAKGRYEPALSHFERAAVYTPNYATLEVNLGIVKGALQRTAEAETHFLRAQALAPNSSRSYTYYGRWLAERGRTEAAGVQLRRAVALNPADLDARGLLMRVHFERAEWNALEALVNETLRLAPGDATSLEYRMRLKEPRTERSAAVAAPATPRTAEEWLARSLAAYRAGKYEECIEAAKASLRLRPAYAEAYNNIAAGHNGLGRWAEGVQAARKAVELKPDFELARNNLAHAERMQAAAQAKR